MWDWPLIAIVFLTIVTLLVAAHELGHYLFARLFGMGVEEFSIGFGKKPIWTWMTRRYPVSHAPRPALPDDEAAALPSENAKIEEEDGYETTVFTIRPWPLGGFVKIKGMIPEEDGSETLVPGGFYSKPPWQRFFVLFAGPVFSLIAGWLVLIPVLTFYGIREPLNEPVLGDLRKAMPGYVAGLRPDDRVLTIDGNPVKTWHDMAREVQKSEGRAQAFVIRRAGKEMAFSVTPEFDKTPGPVMNEKFEPTGELKKQFRIGAGYQTHLSKKPFGEALTEAATYPFKMAAGLLRLIQQPSRFQDEVGGPATMVAATAASARAGVWPTISLAGLLSISLGIFNLLPAVPLDGGQMAVAVIEMFRRGRRLSFRVQNWVAGVGFAFVAMLILGVFAADAKRFLPFLSGPKEKIEVATKAEK